MYEKFSELLDKTGKTSYQVSCETGIAPSTLSEWKSGKYKPKVDKLMVLAEYFEVPLEYFLDKKGE